MAHVDDDELPDPEKVYIAASLREARRVEEVLTGHGIEYAVVVEELGRTTLFGTMRHGAAFYVSASQAASCRSLLAHARVGRGLAEPPNPGEHLPE